MAITHQPDAAAAYAHLGYPAYFMTLLGAAKLAGVVVLLAPRLPRLKEWAYAGFAINLVSASFSHLASHDAASHAVTPMVLLAAMLVSWRLRPAGRVMAFAPRASANVVASAAPAHAA